LTKALGRVTPGCANAFGQQFQATPLWSRNPPKLGGSALSFAKYASPHDKLDEAWEIDDALNFTRFASRLQGIQRDSQVLSIERQCA